MVLTADYMWGIESPEEWPNIVRGLVKRGYSDTEIRKIISENAMKIIEKVIG
jgi:membrane dipeptidase